jgi:putative oxygen-independent coproporphyrinogen III oxidase
MTRPFSLYIHVPFCAQKCPYCDFNTYATPKIPEAAYVDALLEELTGFASDARFQGRSLETIFFGGGTPSLLSPQAIGRVIERAAALFPLLPGVEISIEANPSSPSVDRFRDFKRAGVNRISFGVQSFAPATLALLGRDHSAADACMSVEQCVEAGIDNVSLDIIYGVPGQTVRNLEADLLQAAALPLMHLSAYALSIEPGTPFFQRQERGLLTAADDEVVAEMMDMIPRVLAAHGFSRYEISNYARHGKESAHNSVYWIGGDYLGIGAGAHSYCGEYEGDILTSGSRWSTLAQPQGYMAAATKRATVSWRETLSQEALSFEFFYLGLRRTAGVSNHDFKRRFGRSWDELFLPRLTELQREGFIEFCDDDRVKLTSAGIKLSDSVFERLALEE